MMAGKAGQVSCCDPELYRILENSECADPLKLRFWSVEPAPVVVSVPETRRDIGSKKALGKGVMRKIHVCPSV